MSAIWWDETWNPITGCLPDFECWQRCWARRMAKRLAANPAVKHRERYIGFEPCWWQERMHPPWGPGKRIFVCGMGDLFAERGTFRAHGHMSSWVEIRAAILERMRAAEEHEFFLLTKRTARLFAEWSSQIPSNQIPQNVWVGTSASTIDDLLIRCPLLAHTSTAGRRFLSLEPLLEGVDIELEKILLCGNIHLVIVGAETGPGARYVNVDAIDDVVQACVRCGVPVFVKGWGDPKQGWFRQGLLFDGRNWTQQGHEAEAWKAFGQWQTPILVPAWPKKDEERCHP